MDIGIYGYVDSLLLVSKSTAGERFAKLMDDKGIGIRQLGRMAGLSHGTIQNLRDRGLGASSHETVRRVALALGMTPENLRRIDDGLEPISDSAIAKMQKYEVHPNWLQFPVYGPVSAGDVAAGPIEDDVAFIPKEHLARRGANAETVRVYYVNGRCMLSPEVMKIDRSYAPGDYVAVDLGKQAEAGDVVVAWWEERDVMILKRLGLEEDGIVLTPIAPGHPNVELSPDADVAILGPVVWRGG